MSKNPTQQRLERQVEDLWHQLRVEKSKNAQLDPLDWTPDSRDLLQDVRELLGLLELHAHPLRAITYDDGGSHSAGDPPMPGEAQTRDRRRLERFSRRVRAAIRDTYTDLENLNSGVTVRREPRPRCQSCGRLGFSGDIVCGRGCGPYQQEAA